jgi:hypothetical protein
VSTIPGAVYGLRDGHFCVKDVVGILSFQDRPNYGAVLQAAALEHICRGFGFEVWQIDFRAKPSKYLRVRARYGRLLRDLKIYQKAQYASQDLIELETFLEEFRLKHLSRTKPIYVRSHFNRFARRLDSVIVGSDQVWRPKYAKDPLAYFLSYAPKGVRRIAYAASFGTSEWAPESNPAFTAQVAALLAKFDAISCREDSGVTICQEVFGVKAYHVLDPLLLVSDAYFDSIMDTRYQDNDNGVVCYKLDRSPQFFADAKEIGRRRNEGVRTVDAIPLPEWLGLLNDANVVITDSFHGLCLAIRFKKEFIYCPTPFRGEARIESLFRMFDVSLERVPNIKSSMYEATVHGSVEGILSEWRSRSSQFLLTALSS